MTRLFSFLRRHKKKSVAGAIILVLVGFGVASAGRPKEPEYLTEIAKKTDIRQTVEAVGTITSERELELRFSGVGIVSAIYVQEGQRVAAGQRLAQLRGGALGASVASQQAALQTAVAEFRALQEGTRPEDIAIAEADLRSKQAALEVAQSTLKSAEDSLKNADDQLRILQQEANVNLAGQVTTSMTSLTEQLVSTENALSVIDDILSRVDIQDAIIRDRPGADNDVRKQKQQAQDLIDTARRGIITATDYPGALNALASGRLAITAASGTMDALFRLVSSLPETSYFPTTTRETYKTTITTERSRIQTAGGGLSTAESNLRNASASYDTKIASQKASITTSTGTRDKAKADILTYQAAIQSSQAQLALKKAGTRKADIDASAARVRAAQANLARAQADYADTILVAPVSGTVTHSNVKIGETLPAGAAMSLLGDSPFRVEMFVSEIDVPKLALTQSGSIELDAFRGVHMKLSVSQIGTAPTLKDGVSKYGVKLDFRHHHPELRIGMTGDAEIVTGTRTGVVAVPRRAVLDSTGSGTYVRILKEDKTVEERLVTIGMEGESGDVEVTSGVEEGETIVVLEKK